MWQLDCEESWALKNWCFWTVVLEKTLESPLDWKGSNQSILKEISPGCSLETDAKAETLILWPPHAKSWLIGKDSDAGRDWWQEEKGTAEDEMAGWHHWLDGHESQWTSGVDDGQGGLACCDSWGRKESDATEQLNWTDNFWRLFVFWQFLFWVSGSLFNHLGLNYCAWKAGLHSFCLIHLCSRQCSPFLDEQWQ